MNSLNRSNLALAAHLLIESGRATGKALPDIDLVTSIERCLDAGMHADSLLKLLVKPDFDSRKQKLSMTH
ncbi:MULTISPECIES: hypothetical protein [unclassified Marinobacterium]|uniref:hypothetical protein n=1 Tax=unclassified Marinobacterium TaxID=2644139 RepID=UPI0015694689|nr:MULTISPECIES: hypothetical protein [unclassified Marinobacterium]NRP09034.1 hypothetical protein [Marinobacterium sp. xm-g-48]NRP82435.1 hypothetical protein [Marinobacterium sp. xm-d-509]